MFDFVNYTYSGIISVLSTLFGLAYPLILGCIEKIDSKYGSTKLTDRFKKETVFITFKNLLVANLIVAVLFPFLMDGCSHSRWLISIQCICAIWMVFYAFRLFTLIMQYYDAKELMRLIEADFKDAFEKKDKEKEAIYFTQWSDLTSVSINSADDSLVQSIYDEWYNYVLTKREEYKNKPIDYDDYFYDGITRLNVNLCKNERKPISVNNSNSLLTSLIDGDANITDKTFYALWRNLRIQLHYGREDLILAYWKCASQKYDIFFRELSSFDRDIETQKPYSKEKIALRKKQRELFFEFHIMLCSMLVQEKKYNLVEQILLFTSSEPPVYPLVPSKVYDILKCFIDVNQKEYSGILYYEQRYPMPHMHGITGGRIVAAANCYLALLFYRIYTLHWYYGVNYALGTGALPRTQNELAGFKDILVTLEYWLKEISKNKDLLGTIGLYDLNEFVEQWKKEGIPGPLEIVERLRNELDSAMEDSIINQPLDKEIINQEINQVKGRLSLSIKPYTKFINLPSASDKPFNLNSSQTHLYSNSAFQKDTAVNIMDIGDAMFNSIWQSFTHFFSSAFFVEHQNVDYKIDSSLLFKTFDKLIGDSKEYLIICFGIYLDYYLDQTEGLTDVGDGVYRYNSTIILSLSCPTRVFSQRVYILKKTELPKLTFNKPNEEDWLNEVLADYALWMGVEKVIDTKEDLPKNIAEEIGEQKDKYCLFKAYWIPVLYFSSSMKMTCLKVNYKMSDEGNWNSLNDIRPL